MSTPLDGIDPRALHTVLSRLGMFDLPEKCTCGCEVTNHADVKINGQWATPCYNCRCTQFTQTDE